MREARGPEGIIIELAEQVGPLDPLTSDRERPQHPAPVQHQVHQCVLSAHRGLLSSGSTR